jgi:hypothetical protein
MIDGLPLSFFLPLVVHALAGLTTLSSVGFLDGSAWQAVGEVHIRASSLLASQAASQAISPKNLHLKGLTTGVTGVLAFRAPKRRGRYHRWGKSYLWAYTVVFLTATILSVQRWPSDAYLFVLATVGYGFALGGYGARRFRQEPFLVRVLGKQWVVAHIIGVIGSYVVLWTAFYVDNAHLIPGLKELPTLTFWVLPTVIALPFLAVSLSRFAPNTVKYLRLDPASKGEH